MAKPPTTTRRSINLLLDHAANHLDIGAPLPSETRMAEIAESSRTAVRGALRHLAEHGLVASMKERYLLRKPRPDDYFDVSELHSATEQLQQVLMERIYERDLPPGAEFTEAELSRAAGVSTIAVREFLIGFSRNGLISKNPRGGWRLCAFDTKYAQELGEAREMFELKSIERIAALPPGDPVFARLDELLARHEALAGEPAEGRAEFPALDREFHTFLIGLLDNRFAENLNEVVSMVYHYHYQWDKRDEIPRNRHALQEHLAILRPLASGDVPAALAAMRIHLRSSRSTMLNSLRNREGRTHAQ
ncbi:GntR family transcriptional regulator [Pseudoduganella namucuonensis]|uniref:Transcriptional regulator, GntR family n=1 Tax=Pseudoduganella namucuonensis TaxID=1035707 RepID=A0A1I7LHF5_9BURK|nr:GntR family transcriptional regulator [Pseudoduganella namucuonensis]SFV09054.1 transcriptional regulator, GntR family [Pseudoduganella namucuonensis]